MKDRITHEVHTENETANLSKEAKRAVVFKKMNEAKIKENEPFDPELTLKPDISKTSVVVRHKVYFHTGVYEENKFEKDEMAWSCCMDEEEKGDGCCSQRVKYIPSAKAN